MCHCHRFQMGCFVCVCVAKIWLGGSGYSRVFIGVRVRRGLWHLVLSWLRKQSISQCPPKDSSTGACVCVCVCVFTQLLRMMKCTKKHTLIVFCAEQSVQTPKHLLLESYTHQPTNQPNNTWFLFLHKPPDSYTLFVFPFPHIFFVFCARLISTL